jgi:hypothetical protein
MVRSAVLEMQLHGVPMVIGHRLMGSVFIVT